MSQLQARGAVVFGVSADTVESHRRFAASQKLNFPLLADPDKQMIAAYGVLGPSGAANRATFIIGPDGRIAGIDRAVNEQFSRVGEKLISRHGTNLALLLTDWKAKIGSPVPSFSLPGTDGRTAPLFRPGSKAAVVLFLSTECPVSRAYEGRMKALAGDPAYKDVSFLGVYSNATETAAQQKAHAAKSEFNFPVARDQGNVIADHFGARATPTAWVVDGRGIAAYRGAIDDSQDPAQVKETYLRNALQAVLAGEPVKVAETPAFGCAISRVKK